ncbi:MAG: YceI family protein [Bacteroidales bacterium]|nr:YceI family protein [Bacteroidales bacterium]MBN2819369.1 YceI family protein [Bacteroidales bacterium]
MRKLNLFSIVVATIIATSISAQEFTVDPEKSSLEWKGKKVGGEHYGNISLKEGNFVVKDNNIASGKFVIDMTTITNSDLEGEWNEKLVGHLKSDDFFGVEKYPTSELVIKKSSTFSNNEAKVSGDLTIKGKTHPIEFTVKRDGENYSAKITVDRSKYDVRYGSKSFFDNLGDKAIHDDFTMKVKVVVK